MLGINPGIKFLPTALQSIFYPFYYISNKQKKN